jgi:hypothetical protein
MAGWPYTIVYSREDDVIMVWVLAHHKRQPAIGASAYRPRELAGELH